MDSVERLRRSGRGSFAFCAALTALLAALWIVAARRDGSWAQVPFWDSAWYHVHALRMKRAMEEGGLVGWLHAWVRTSSTHAPLVPTVSALLMFVAGESRAAAEMVLPLSAFLLLWSTFRVSERLFGRPTAFAATALTATFPVFLTYTRGYYFEAPMAALFAAACWALVESDRFGRLAPTLAFGVLSGLLALARMGAGVLLVGPALVAAVLAFRADRRGVRLARLAIAVAIALAMAATWYAPNLGAIVEYLHRVTYGSQAQVFAGGSSAFSPENFSYYLQWAVLDGPGVPIVAAAALGFAGTASAGRAPSLVSPAGSALLAVFAADFLLLLLAAQHMGGALLLPLMPILAVAVVRCVAIVPHRAARAALAVVVAAFALHHVIACTFLFPVAEADDAPRAKPIPTDSSGPRGRSFVLPQLWNHGDFFLDWSRSGGGDHEVNYRVPDVVARLETLSLPDDARVSVLTDICFFEAASLHLEALRRHRSWGFEDRPHDQLEALDESDAVVIRTGGAFPEGSRRASARFDAMNDRVRLHFESAGDAIELGDGAQVRVLRRVPGAFEVTEIPFPAEHTIASFGDPENPAVVLDSAHLEERADGRDLLLAFALPARPEFLPRMEIRVGDGEHELAPRSFRWRVAHVGKGATAPCHVVARIALPNPLPEPLETGGYRVILRIRSAGTAPARACRGGYWLARATGADRADAPQVVVWNSPPREPAGKPPREPAEIPEREPAEIPQRAESTVR